jgi:hypothetical protein
MEGVQNGDVHPPEPPAEDAAAHPQFAAIQEHRDRDDDANSLPPAGDPAAAVHELNELRTLALRAVDNARFSFVVMLFLLSLLDLDDCDNSWRHGFHAKLCVIAGTGFFTDA